MKLNSLLEYEKHLDYALKDGSIIKMDLNNIDEEIVYKLISIHDELVKLEDAKTFIDYIVENIPQLASNINILGEKTITEEKYDIIQPNNLSILLKIDNSYYIGNLSNEILENEDIDINILLEDTMLLRGKYAKKNGKIRDIEAIVISRYKDDKGINKLLILDASHAKDALFMILKHFDRFSSMSDGRDLYSMIRDEIPELLSGNFYKTLLADNFDGIIRELKKEDLERLLGVEPDKSDKVEPDEVESDEVK